MRVIARFLQRRDLTGPGVKLNFNGHESIGTVCGGICSLVITLFMTFFIFLVLFKWATEIEYEESVTEKYLPVDPDHEDSEPYDIPLSGYLPSVIVIDNYMLEDPDQFIFNNRDNWII